MAWIWGILLLVIAFYGLYKFAYLPYQVLKHCRVKGPTPIPFFGNYLEIQKKGVLKFEKELFDKFGPVSGYYIGKLPAFLIADLEMLKQISVKRFDSFTNKMPRLKTSAGRVSDGLVLAEGEAWRFKRRMVTPTFSTSRIKQMIPLIENSVKTLVEILGEKADTGRSFDVKKIYASFTMETILATAFGRAVAVQRGEADSLTEAAEDIFRFVRGNWLLGQAIISNFPWLDPLMAYFMKPSWSYSVVYSTLSSLVRDRRRETKRNEYKDLLQLIMDATGEDGDESAPANSKLSDDEVVNITMDVLLGGYDTTFNTLSFASYVLSLHPDIQRKLQDEITSYYEKNPDVSYYTAALEIKYLDMVIQEVLRLYPVAPKTGRRCSEATDLHGIHIPKGVLVVLPIHLLHSDPKYWQDPDKFDPSRFTAEEKAKRPHSCHVPFGFGPRSCIGMRLALLELKMTLIELLKHFTFTRAPDTEVPLQTTSGFTLTSCNDIYLKINNRKT